MNRPSVLENLAWPEKAMIVLEAEASTGRAFESCDLESRWGLEPPDSPSQWGSLFQKAARQGKIQLAGYGVSNRPSRAGGITRLWVGIQSISTKENSSDAHSAKNRIEAA